jgi:hypothetical protein
MAFCLSGGRQLAGKQKVTIGADLRRDSVMRCAGANAYRCAGTKRI